MLVYVWPFGLFYDHLVYFVAILDILHMVIWYIFPRFGMLCKEKSGNPGAKEQMRLFRLEWLVLK
jgi:hypothetical protein